jgi:hypothetical protein
MNKVKVYNLMKEREIFDYDRNKGQILTEGNYVQNIFQAVGFASRCWTKKNGRGILDTEEAIRICNELCAYVRLIGEGKIKIQVTPKKPSVKPNKKRGK